ncbi:MAG: hypothetical protein ACREBK_04800 [Sphingomicrobium sp.]
MAAALLALAMVGTAPAFAAPACPLPKLDFRAAETLSENDRARLTENFRAAYEKACVEGLMADGPLIDPEAVVKDTIFVLNAPEANVTSIYFHFEGKPPRTMIESPFGEPPQIPSVEDLHEAIFCAVRGATPEEQETTGRCLPD